MRNSTIKFPVHVLGEGVLAKLVLKYLLHTYQVKSTKQAVPDTTEVGEIPTSDWAQVFYACNQ